MKKKFLDITLYISSFIPLYFLIIVKELIEIANGNLTFNVTNSIMLCLNFLLIILGVVGVIIALKQKPTKTMELVEQKNITRQNFLPYFPLFVLFAIAFELEFISMAVVYVLILIMVGLVYVKNSLFDINPFLNIIGFSTYEIRYKNETGELVSEKVFVFGKLKSNTIKANSLFIK